VSRRLQWGWGWWVLVGCGDCFRRHKSGAYRDINIIVGFPPAQYYAAAISARGGEGGSCQQQQQGVFCLIY
jgi:hypothetical protein